MAKLPSVLIFCLQGLCVKLILTCASSEMCFSQGNMWHLHTMPVLHSLCNLRCWLCPLKPEIGWIMCGELLRCICLFPILLTDSCFKEEWINLGDLILWYLMYIHLPMSEFVIFWDKWWIFLSVVLKARECWLWWGHSRGKSQALHSIVGLCGVWGIKHYWCVPWYYKSMRYAKLHKLWKKWIKLGDEGRQL